MSEELVKSVQEMLKEETWTRATISNYTKNNLIEARVQVSSLSISCTFFTRSSDIKISYCFSCLTAILRTSRKYFCQESLFVVKSH